MSQDRSSAADGKEPVMPNLPDPAYPPQNRGQWEKAALINVDITEVVKDQIRTRTRPQNK